MKHVMFPKNYKERNQHRYLPYDGSRMGIWFKQLMWLEIRTDDEQAEYEAEQVRINILIDENIKRLNRVYEDDLRIEGAGL